MKRWFDFTFAVCGLALLGPLILWTALFVRLILGAPILFKQVRPGLFGKPFTLYKFRTMTNQLDQSGNPLPDHLRLTPFGRFLRKCSLDELPQLYNVLKGEMSFVGPRPLLMDYLPLYSKEQAKRHQVRPGITGLAQVSGRNSIGWKEKFELDVWYVENRTFLLDLKILFFTVLKVFKTEGINQAGQATMERFTGTESYVGRDNG
jgi:sugar transferase EpsL